MKVKSESEVTQSYLTLSDPMDCSLPGSSVHRIFQARVLEWGATAFSDQYSILMHIYGNQKDCNDNPVCETAKDSQMYIIVLDSVGEEEGEGEGAMIWENGIETCIISYKK